MSRIRGEFPRAGDLTMLGAHSSHSYQTGTNLYFVYDYTINCSPREEIEVYHKPLNAIIVEEALRAGGSMVHHHGIGKYRTPWVRQEHGSAYYLLSTLKQAFDPQGVMNAGTIFPLAPDAGARPAEPTVTPYLLAIDNGSQSTKVTIFDARGHALASARRRLKPYDTSVPGHAVHPGDDIWDSIQDACRDVMARFAGDPAGHRGGRPVHHQVLPGSAGRGRQPGRAGAELDGRAGRPALRAGQPAGPLRHHLLRLHHPPPDRPLHGRRGQLPGCLAHRPGHGHLVGRSRRLRRRPACRATCSSTWSPRAAGSAP